MSVKLLTEHHLEFLSLKTGCTGSSESSLVKIPHCWKSHVAAHIQKTCCQDPLVKFSESAHMPLLLSLYDWVRVWFWLCGTFRTSSIPVNILCGFRHSDNVFSSFLVNDGRGSK